MNPMTYPQLVRLKNHACERVFQTRKVKNIPEERVITFLRFMLDADVLPSCEIPFMWTYTKPGESPSDLDHRVRTKLGRIISRQFPEVVNRLGIKDHEINAIIASINEFTWTDPLDLCEIGNGTFIQRAYNEVEGTGSCMEGDNVELYVCNPDIVSCVRFKNKGRALVWHIPEAPAPLMDRIYPNDCNNQIHRVLLAYGKKMGYIIRDHHALPEDNVTFDDECYSVKLRRPSSEYGYPYLDSFHYIERITDEYLYLSTCCDDDDEGRMCHTDGTLNRRSCCCICGDSYSEHDDDIRYLDAADGDVCYSCEARNFTRCYECDDIAHNDDTYYIENRDRSVCSYCYDNYYTLCESCTEHFHVDDTIYVTNDGSYCEHCFEDKFIRCEQCNEVTPKADMFVFDGECVCETCYDKLEESKNLEDDDPKK